MEKWSPEPQTQRQVVGGLSPSDTENNPFPTDPIHPHPSGGENPVDPLTFQLCPSWYPPWLIVSTAIAQTYGSLIIPAQDVIDGGKSCRVQTLMQGIPQGMPSSSSFPDLSAFVQGESQSPDIGPRSLLLKRVGPALPGLGIQYSPISGRVKAHGTWSPVSHPSLLNLKVNLTIAGWRVMMGHKPSRY